MIEGAGNALFVGAILLVVPAMVTRSVVGADWPQVMLAFPIFWFLLAMVLGFGKLNQEVLGWTLIMAMFTSWFGVPMIGSILRAFSIPQRFF